MGKTNLQQMAQRWCMPCRPGAVIMGARVYSCASARLCGEVQRLCPPQQGERCPSDAFANSNVCINMHARTHSHARTSHVRTRMHAHRTYAHAHAHALQTDLYCTVATYACVPAHTDSHAHLEGSFRKATTSCSSALASGQPFTSEKRLRDTSGTTSCASRKHTIISLC